MTLAYSLLLLIKEVLGMKFTKRQLLDWLLDVTGAEEVYPFTREKASTRPSFDIGVIKRCWL